MAKEQEEIIKLLAKNEVVLMNLYLTYTKKFPDYEKFWRDIALEEKSHARWIFDLEEKTASINVNFDINKFNKEAITSSINYIEERNMYAQKNEMDIKTALSIAKDIEGSLLEKKVFDVFQTDMPELTNLLKRLKEATQEHYDRVSQKLDEVIKG